MKRRFLVVVPALMMLSGVSGCGYNQIQTLDEQTNQMSGNIQTELQRRNDLIPNLVATVDQASKLESNTQIKVAEARSGLTGAKDQMSKALAGGAANQDQVAAADAQVQSQLRNYINVSVEAYPNLKSNEQFTRLQDELTET